MKIVVTLPVNETHKKAFQDAAPEAEFVYVPGPDVTEELLQTVDATIGNIPVDKFKGYENILINKEITYRYHYFYLL